MHRTSAPLALAVLAGLAGPALAQVPLPPYTRWAMPDFDQRRSGLANNGANHCVPTAHCNMLAYIADHGFAPLFPGVSHSWNPLEYGDITDHVHDLGVMMSTSGTSGTTGTNKKAGFNQWVFGHGGAFLFNINYQSGPDVTPWDMYFAMTGGGLVCFSYGRWSYNADDGEYERNGGHCVTLRGIADLQFPFQSNSVRPLLRYRDPASDEGNVSGRLTGQSTFKTSELRIRPFTSDFEGYGEETFWMLITDSDDGVRRIIDGFTSITPVFYMQNNIILGQLSVFTPVQMIDSSNQGTVNVPGLIDAAFGKTSTHVFGLANNATGGTSRLVLANPIAGQITHTLTVPGQNGRLAPGRDGDVFVFNNALITRYRPSDDEPAMTPLGSSQPITAGVSNICYDDLRDGPTLLMGDGSVREYDKSLATFVSKTLATPPGWPPSAGPTHRRIIPGNEPGPAGADYWFGPLTNNQLKRYAPAPSVPIRLVLVETVTPPPGATLVDFSLTDRGSLLLNRGGVLQELVRNDADEWLVDPDSSFNGLPASGPIRMSRSRTNYNPAIHDLPGWNLDIINPEPIAPEAPDCLADVGRTGGLAEPDGLLNNNDFVVFIDFFFASDLRADIGSVGGAAGADGFHNNNDFVVFIDRFFQGC